MKTILIPFRDDDVARAAVDAACLLASSFQSYIEGLFIQTPPLVYASEGIAIGGYVTQLADEERQRADEAHARFEALMKEHGVPLGDRTAETSNPTAGWHQVDGLGEQVVGEYGRLFDVVAVGRGTSTSSPDWSVLCEAALFDSGRLVLLASPKLPAALGENVVVAWNGSTETARTIALAMPLLKRAARVTVLTIEGGTVPGPNGDQVAQYLMRHGIDAATRTAEPEGRTVGEAMLEETDALGADCLVKGAYAHSRLRQMIFGGATRHILSATEIPVLMAH